jgi:integrase
MCRFPRPVDAFSCDLFAIAALTGRRLSNVRELEWENVDLES